MRRATELLEISPAALSKAMRLLEDELGYPLLLPHGRGIKLTEQGTALASRLGVTLPALEASLRPVSPPSPPSGGAQVRRSP